MYTNNNLAVIQDDASFDGLNGTQYSSDYPKSEIDGIYPVVLTTKPTDPDLMVTGFTIVKTTLNSVDTYTQTWQTRAKTQGELDSALATAKDTKNTSLYASYLASRSADISFTTAGSSTKDYQADDASIYAIQGMLDTYIASTPVGFYWKALDNTKVTPFLRSDLEGLANAIGARAWGYFQNLTDKKDAVLSCTTVAQVNAIAW